MTKELDVRLESLTYAVHFARPALEFWGAGGRIIRQLHDALSPFGVALGNIQVNPGVLNAAGQIITVVVPPFSTLKFAFDRIEFEANNFSSDFFESVPKVLASCTGWIKSELSDFKFAAHNVGYFCHSFVKGSTTKEVLESMNPRSLKGGGMSLGSGTIFHNFVSERNWNTRFWFDHSLGLTGALFIALIIDLKTDLLDYTALMSDGRSYFRSVLEELDLRLPEVED